MATPLKDLYSPTFFSVFADALTTVLPSFNKKKFTQQIFDGEWESKELKQRMRHTALVLRQFLPTDFSKAAPLIVKLITALRKKGVKEAGVEFMFLPDYIALYGIDTFKTAVDLFELVTPFTSCEFAVRPFIIKYGDKMLGQMLRWSLHPNHHVRRLASEGSRPRLPWAIALPELKKDPAPILPILENLKKDPSEYVRRSVANSLNDIAKDNPQTVIAIAKQWKGLGKETDALIKHGCRTLLKQGNKPILQYFGLLGNTAIEVTAFRIQTPKVPIGQHLAFSFVVQHDGRKPQTLRLEYAVHYLRQNGTLSKKVFKISEREVGAGQTLQVERKQSFRPITTKKFYTGQHRLSIIVNGQEKGIATFELTV
jgi:3-methyladenine DNA glycosylase AlkC